MDFNEQLRRIQAAQGDPQKLALATLDILLASHPPELRRAFEAAAIPHWFDEGLLTRLLDEDLRADAGRWFQAVIAIPAVEPFPARQGYNVHEATRLGLRRRLFADKPDRFVELARRAAAAFAGDAAYESIERVYHLLVAEPREGGPSIRELSRKLIGRIEETLALAQTLEEYTESEIWPPEVRGWAFLSAACNRTGYRTQAEIAAAANNALQALEGTNEHWARALAHRALGDVAVATGNLAEAQRCFTEFHGLMLRLGSGQLGPAELQADFVASLRRLGDVLSDQGNLAEALSAYHRSLAITERLAKADPSSTGWQRDLSVNHSKIGDVLLDQGDLAEALEAYRQSMAVRERLVESDPSNAGWQRDLSVNHIKIGDVLRAQGDLAGALEAFRQSMAVAERLAQSDPSNAGWQRDLSVSQDRIGDVLRAQGDLAGALEAYRQSMAVRERLVESDPSNAMWQSGLALSHQRLAIIAKENGDEAGYVAGLRNCFAVLHGMKQRNLHLDARIAQVYDRLVGTFGS